MAAIRLEKKAPVVVRAAVPEHEAIKIEKIFAPPSVVEKKELRIIEPRPAKEKIEKPASPYLNKRQAQLLEHIKSSGRITRKEYSDLFNISVPTAARDLKYLMDKGFLKAEGPLGPGRWYELK